MWQQCSELILGGPECEDCVNGLGAGCTQEQMDHLCWATGDDAAVHHASDAFEQAVKSGDYAEASVVVLIGISVVFLLVGLALLQSLKPRKLQTKQGETLLKK